MQIGIVMLENAALSEITASAAPYLSGLYNDAANVKVTTYHSTCLPSYPNYMAVTCASNLGNCTDSVTTRTGLNNLFTQMQTAGHSWKTYEEGGSLAPTPFQVNAGGGTAWPYYALRHCPAQTYSQTKTSHNRVDFIDAKAADGVANTGLITDIANKSLPDFFFISPNLVNDGHSPGSVTTCDKWCAGNTTVSQSAKFTGLKALAAAMRNDGWLVVTFDSNGVTAPLYCLIMPGGTKSASAVADFTSNTGHFGLVKGIQDAFGLAHWTTTGGVGTLDTRYTTNSPDAIITSFQSGSTGGPPNAPTITTEPPSSDTNRTPTFAWHANDGGGATATASWGYKLDGASSYTTLPLATTTLTLPTQALGAHTFKISAFASDGTTHSSDTTYTWTIVSTTVTAPTNFTSSVGATGAHTTATSATFSWSSGGADDVDYQYILDGGAPVKTNGATSVNLTNLTVATHTFQVQALNSSGTASASVPSSAYSWTVDSVVVGTARTIFGQSHATGAPPLFDRTLYTNAATALGRSVITAHTLYNWGDAAPTVSTSDEKWIHDQGGIPIINCLGRLLPTATGQNFPNFNTSGTPNDTGMTAIANGTYDTQLKAWAQFSKDLGFNHFARVWREMTNGAGACVWKTSTGPIFIAAWKRMYTIFKASSYTDYNTNVNPSHTISGSPINASNVTMIWCPAVFGGDWTTWYPGDAYVDWVGTDFYSYDTTATASNNNGPQGGWHTFKEGVTPFYNQFNSQSGSKAKKPLILCEINCKSSTNAGRDRAQWFTDAHANMVNDFPLISGWNLWVDSSWPDFNVAGSDEYIALANDPIMGLTTIPSSFTNDVVLTITDPTSDLTINQNSYTLRGDVKGGSGLALTINGTPVSIATGTDKSFSDAFGRTTTNAWGGVWTQDAGASTLASTDGSKALVTGLAAGGTARFVAGNSQTGALFGAYPDTSNTGNTDPSSTTVPSRETTIARQYDMVLFFASSTPASSASMTANFPEWLLDNDRMPIISTSFSWGNSTFPGYQNILSGAQDTKFDAWAARLVALQNRNGGSTLVFRMFQEMNGNWFNYGRQVTGYTTDFKLMWQYIVNRFRAQGVDTNRVLMCWCPNTEANTSISTATTDAAWPGVGYVGVIGLDLYNKDSSNSGAGMSYQTGWSSFYTRYAQYNLPMISVECGCVDHTLNQRRDWLNAALAYMKGGTVPLIKGFCYWDAVGTGTDSVTGHLFEYRVDHSDPSNGTSSTNSLNAYKAMGADSYMSQGSLSIQITGTARMSDADLTSIHTLSANPVGGAFQVHTLFRRTDANNMYHLNVYQDATANNPIFASLTKQVAGVTTTLQSATAVTPGPSPGTQICRRVKYVGPHLQAKVWTGLVSDEPGGAGSDTNWLVDTSDSSLSAAGDVGVSFFRASGETAAITASFDALTVTDKSPGAGGSGNFTWPVTLSKGANVFQFAATDTAGGTDTATRTITFQDQSTGSGQLPATDDGFIHEALSGQVYTIAQSQATSVQDWQDIADTYSIVIDNAPGTRLYPYADDIRTRNPDTWLGLYIKGTGIPTSLTGLPENWYAHTVARSSPSFGPTTRLHLSGSTAYWMAQPDGTGSWTDTNGTVGANGHVYNSYKEYHAAEVVSAISGVNARYQGSSPLGAAFLDSLGVGNFNGQVDPITGAAYSANKASWYSLVNQMVQYIAATDSADLIETNGVDSNTGLGTVSEVAMIEGWMFSQNGSTNTPNTRPTPTQIRNVINAAINAQDSGCYVSVLDYTRDAAGQTGWQNATTAQKSEAAQLILAAYYLANQGKLLVEWSTQDILTGGVKPWTADRTVYWNTGLLAPRDTQTQLGTSVGQGYCIATGVGTNNGNVYRRRYLQGVVYLNEGNAPFAVTLDRADYQEQGSATLLTSPYTLPPQSGTILVAASNPSTGIQAIPPFPAVTGTETEGATLTCSPGSYNDDSGNPVTPTSTSYNWQYANDDGSGNAVGTWFFVGGLATSTLVIPHAQVGTHIRCVVDAVDSSGNHAVTTTNVTGVIAAATPSPPVVTAAPVVTPSGISPQPGDVLSSTPGSFSSATSQTIRWQRGDDLSGSYTDIGGATSSPYTVQNADVGFQLHSVAKATNSGGSTESTSNSTLVVTLAVVPPSNTSLPTITGDPIVGQTLQGDKGEWTGDNLTFDYQWQRR